MSKVAHGGVHVSQTSTEMRLFSENLHVVTSRSLYNFVETRHIGWTNGKVVLRGQSSWSSWSVVFRGQSFFLVVVVSLLRDQSFFLLVVVSHFSSSVSRLNRCGQSSLSVVFFVVSRSSWMVFVFCGGYAHVFTDTYGWVKPRSMSGQLYGGG